MVDVISQNGAEEFEDGELPEDGEICDDDDEVAAPSKSSQPEFQPQSSSSEVSNSSGSHRDRADRERDRDRERVRDRETRRSRRSEDQAPVRDLDPFGPGSDDGQQLAEAYGTGGGDKDYRSIEDEYNDVDYRISRRRRHSPQNEDMDSRAKRPPPYYNSRPASYRGGLHGAGANPRYENRHPKPAGGPPRFNTEKQICKFFREGYCRDGDNCSYSHNTEDSLRRPILCNFYANSYCKKGLQCLMLHGEYPCREFHQNGCQNDQCKYSHLPLTEYTKPLYEASLQDDHPLSQYQPPPKHHHQHHQPHHRAPPTALPPPPSQIASSQSPALLPAPMPSRRKVLLPGGPANLSPPHQIHAPIPQSMNGGQLPPPSVVVPTRGAGYPSTGYFNQGPQPLMGSGTGAGVGAGGALPPVRNIEPPRPVVQPMMGGQAQGVPALEKPAVTPVQPAFNIEAMLNKLAKGGDLSGDEDDSPASPPPPLFPINISTTNITPIPSSTEMREAPWRLVRVIRQPAYYGVENIDQIAANDPRKARCISAQFDAISNIFGGAPIGGDPRLAANNSSSTKKLSPVITSSWMPQMS